MSHLRGSVADGFITAAFSMPGMAVEQRLSISELRTLEAQVVAQPTDEKGAVVFLKDGMLAEIRSAIAAQAELERRR